MVEPQQKNLMARFKGDGSKVKITAWLAVFNNTFADKDDATKIKLLGQYLEDEALTWYAEEILEAGLTTFQAAKETLISRFDKTHIRPIISAKDRMLDSENESLQDYYNDKMRLLRQTKLEDLDKVALLTEGLPSFYRTPMIAGGPTTPTTWLSLALQLEKSFKKNPRFIKKKQDTEIPAIVHMVGGPNKQRQRPSNGSKSSKPPAPCSICRKVGLNEEWHWHSDCPNKDRVPKPKRDGPAPQLEGSVNITEALHFGH